MMAFTHRSRRLLCAALVLGAPLWSGLAATGGPGAINPADLKEWLTYVASDELQGRALFSTGLGLAAAYVSDHLRMWGVKPAGDKGSYLQTVQLQSVKSTSRSTITVQIGSESRTFADGDAVMFPKNAGGRQRLTIDRVEFAGYGLDLPAANHHDVTGRDVKGAVVVWLGPEGPRDVDSQKYRLLLERRSESALDQQAAGTIGPESATVGARGGRGGHPPGEETPEVSAANGVRGPSGDFVTVERLDTPRPPLVSARDGFFEFLFSHAPSRYQELKRKAAAREPLPAFRLEGVRLIFNIDVDYEVVRTQLAQNIVAIVDGSDPQLRNSYVALGAHYDHVGYAQGEVVKGENGPHRVGAPGRVTDGALDDRIWNGADDDGTGTVALMSMARALAEGTRPKRSVLFVWHTGEERGRYGSLYFTGHPTIPFEAIVAQLNVDMIGRNRDNRSSEENTVYLVGADRISSELHAISRTANAALPRPMTIDYELNDPSDPESLYTRSDHYSYAAKGVPVIFFTTGLHPDYHANTDEVSKIDFGKMTRVVELVYETTLRLANLDHPPARDYKGPRTGKARQAP
jgi:hypothetical protein